MFDIGFMELALASTILLFVVGPERLPEVVRSVSKFIRMAKNAGSDLMRKIEQEVGADEIRKEIINDNIKATFQQQKQLFDQLSDEPNTKNLDLLDNLLSYPDSESTNKDL
jgi:sec-independent protein translocase protein TatB